MGKKQIEAFFSKLMEDKGLKEKVAVIKDDMDAAYAKIAKIARDAGYDVTPQDVQAARVTFGGGGQLADQEIDKVAGGCSSVCGEVCGMHLGSWVGRQ